VTASPRRQTPKRVGFGLLAVGHPARVAIQRLQGLRAVEGRDGVELACRIGLPVVAAALALEPASRRVSRVFNGRSELIDHILVSHMLVNRIEAVDTSTPELPSIGETLALSQPDAPSDHAAVMTRFATAYNCDRAWSARRWSARCGQLVRPSPVARRDSAR
jgi:hypothetical protein